MAGDRSTPTTRPAGTRRASSSVSRPVPHPMSRTRSVPASGSRSRTFRPHACCGAEMSWYRPAFQSAMRSSVYSPRRRLLSLMSRRHSMRPLLAGPFVAAILAGVITSAQQPRPGVTLGELTWQEAEAILTPSAVVVIPLGAAALEHGPHMRLDNDERLARHLAQ